MRRNSHLINKSDLLATIVEKIETSYSEDVSLLICYGSYVTGNYGARSDIDFFFVPKTKKGYKLGHQFILNNIGYDLWPISWERLTSISRLEEQLASILMDGEVLFASSEDDLLKLDNLKNNVKQNLSNETMAMKISMRYMDKAKAIYFDMQNHELNMIFIDAVNIAEALLSAIAIVNGTYIRKGIKAIEEEINRFSILPVGYLETYRKLVRTNSKAEVQHIVNELIAEAEQTWKTRFDPDTKDVDPSALAGFYEEFKSTYNKLLFACEEKNYEKAYYAGFMIDRETQSFLNNYAAPGIFPSIVHGALGNDYEVIRASCIEHERQLIKLLNKNGIEINTYNDSNAFRQNFLAKMA
jgi:predicted nucleotidyltransferase